MTCIPGYYMYKFICSVILLLITILLLVASLPLNINVLVLLSDIGPYFDFLFSNICADFCNKVSDLAIVT
jgi:hypothetical protein